MAETVRQYISDLQSEQEGLERELADVKLKIAQQELILSTFAPVVQDVRLELEDHLLVEGVADEKLANACRMVLQAAHIYRTPRGVRDTLERSGYDLTQHKNALASIHGVLKRLAESADVEEMEFNGGLRYRWKQNVSVAAVPETARLKIETFAPTVEVRRRGLKNVRLGGK